MFCAGCLGLSQPFLMKANFAMLCSFTSLINVHSHSSYVREEEKRRKQGLQGGNLEPGPNENEKNWTKTYQGDLAAERGKVLVGGTDEAPSFEKLKSPHSCISD